MRILRSLFRKSASVNEMVVVSTFETTLKAFKKAPLPTQMHVGKRILADINSLAHMTPQNLRASQQQAIQKYRDLRNLALKNGATNDRDPEYAYAALMESFALSMTDADVGAMIGGQLMQWLASIHVVE